MNSFENLAGDPSKLSGRRGSKKLAWRARPSCRGAKKGWRSSCLRMKPRQEVENDDHDEMTTTTTTNEKAEEEKEKGEEEEEEEE